MTEMDGRVAGGVLVAVVTALAGCHSWVPIRPTELPKLNETATPVSEPDGTVVEILEPFDARVTTRSGAAVGFKHRVTSSLENRMLVVQGSNRGRTAFPLQDVRSVDVSQPNVGGTTAAAAVLCGVGVILIGVLVANAISN
jgi:type IV pilus biogenesis protein CpaD/CtpE